MTTDWSLSLCDYNLNENRPLPHWCVSVRASKHLGGIPKAELRGLFILKIDWILYGIPVSDFLSCAASINNKPSSNLRIW